MSMHDDTTRPDDDIAADYVMGLLEGAELATAEQRMTADIAFAKAVNVWRERLADLDATAEALEPSAGICASRMRTCSGLRNRLG